MPMKTGFGQETKCLPSPLAGDFIIFTMGVKQEIHYMDRFYNFIYTLCYNH